MAQGVGKFAVTAFRERDTLEHFGFVLAVADIAKIVSAWSLNSTAFWVLTQQIVNMADVAKSYCLGAGTLGCTRRSKAR